MFTTSRPAATLIELILFLMILSIVVVVSVPLMFAATEQRSLQQTIAHVENSAVQTLETINNRVRESEEVVLPAVGSTGSVLMLRTGSSATSPIILGLTTGALILIEHAVQQTLSSPQVSVDHLEVRNVSTSEVQAFDITMTISRSIRLQQPHRYSRTFHGGFVLTPADEPRGNSCGCAPPICNGGSSFEWPICELGTCFLGTTTLRC